MPGMSKDQKTLALGAAAALGLGALVFWALKKPPPESGELDEKEPEPMVVDAPEAAAGGDEAKVCADEVKAEFNAAKQKAFELFKASPPRYGDAAAWFSTAIALAEAHASLASQRVALYNNRSACRERCDDLEASLSDCAVVLESNAMHAKVRRRRARIYEKLGRPVEALVEICADLLIQREAFKKALQAGRQAEQPTPVENVEAVMRAVGKRAAEDALEKRSASASSFGMPSANTITQLLMTYVDYEARVAEAAREVDAAGFKAELEAARGDGAKTVGVLLRRARKATYEKRYEAARKDVELAGVAYERSPTPEAFGDALVAELHRSVGLYKHLVHDLAGASAAYEAALAKETTVAGKVETRVKAAGVFVDAGDMAAADAQLEAALADDPDRRHASDVFMHRAQLRVIRRDLKAAQADLEACIEAAPGHVLARLRLATVLIHHGAPPEAIEAQIAAAERLAPTMSEVFQVKGEILLAKQDLPGAVAQFDKAIALDASNPVPLYNKGLTLIQMNQFEAHNAQKLFEAALKVDPTCMVALMRLSELKLQLAASFDQAQDVVDMLGEAMAHCRDKDELIELSTVRCMAIAQLSAAKDVGLTSFQM